MATNPPDDAPETTPPTPEGEGRPSSSERVSPTTANARPERVIEASARQTAPVAPAKPTPPATPGTDSAPAVRPGFVMVYPQLVSIEFVAMVVFTLLMLLMGTFINAPLEELANPDRTPNPSKAPWYFLNLQELLLHMHPSLAGVVVPAVALLLIAAIPYIDISPEDTGHWFASPKGLQITIFSMVYAVSLETAMILFNEFVGVKRVLSWAPPIVPDILVPLAIMLGFSYLLVVIVKRRWEDVTTRDIMLALFSGFVASFFLLTIVGTMFRGPGMHLFMPWAQPPRTH